VWYQEEWKHEERVQIDVEELWMKVGGEIVYRTQAAKSNSAEVSRRAMFGSGTSELEHSSLAVDVPYSNPRLIFSISSLSLLIIFLMTETNNEELAT